MSSHVRYYDDLRPLTLLLVKYPTMTGLMNPGSTPIMPLIPNKTPAWFGLRSTIFANGPVDTAPCDIVPRVRNTMAAVVLQPEYASNRMNTPFITPHTKPANFLTFVRDNRFVRNIRSPKTEKA